MIALENLQPETFTSLMGDTFRVTAINATGFVDLKLQVVTELGAPYPGFTRPPFSLLFHGAPGLRLPQQMYKFEHASLSPLDMMITQISDTPTESTFEAIFT